MSDDCTQWFIFADENLAVARLSLDGGYFNACLQNIQQAVEKFLKAALLLQNRKIGLQCVEIAERVRAAVQRGM